ncbi:Hpt domain-containing protein [Litoreibacter arenae]|uniref:Chemotaxis protein histidine kinase n=1 Tax=Litoreibacter arenae DSM 19593 TaxID=1123360 RepID=S9Q7W6_9RHOB|nr:Hpt domain-containing protein [Litoreibacter arenae]EPX77466.1 Chemotaxis protein histidine kinase [Litoreibacter arenae DSM 19593]
MLNWSRVAELKDDLGAEDFQEVTALFLEEVEEKLAALGDAPPADDLHFLKGSAANLGFEGFRAMCERMEQMPAAPPVAELHALYQQSKTAFLEGLQT